MSKLLTVFVIIALAGMGVIGDYFIKISGNGEKYITLRYFFIGLVIYACTAFGWFFAMKSIKLSTLGVIYALSTSLMLLAVGVVIFKEHLGGTEILGFIFAIAAILLLSRFS